MSAERKAILLTLTTSPPLASNNPTQQELSGNSMVHQTCQLTA